MFRPRPCGCKGIRTCYVCEAEFGIHTSGDTSLAYGTLDLNTCYEFCHLCGDKAWLGQNVSTGHSASHVEVDEANQDEGVNEWVPFPGVLLVPDFLSEEEEKALVEGCDSMPWDLSQSGRRKQNFGPKTNFKKMKINGKSFDGFPKFSKYFQDKLRQVELLRDYQTIEQCSIEYRPETGACIDPHIDDCWVWGERVISLNLISDSVLTMTKYEGGVDKYNLRYHYDSLNTSQPQNHPNNKSWPIVRIPMPRRSLLVLYGPARYEWEHCVIRRDISSRRICMAYREFTKEYLPEGKSYDCVGKSVCDKAQNFWDVQNSLNCS